MVGVHGADIGRTIEFKTVAVLRHQRAEGRGDLVDCRRHIERLQKERHSTGFDFREVENVVDQAELVFGSSMDFLEVGNVFFVPGVLDLFLQHF